MLEAWKTALENDGYAILPAIFTAERVDSLLRELHTAFAADQNGSTLRAADGSVYGARNLMQLWPAVIDAWKQAPLPALLTEMLGTHYGLVRVLYFDKPPEQSWALPWHKDATIAVQNNRLPSKHFGKPTQKVGVPHVEAPEWLLQRMLTLRLHLDDMTDANGPLKVIPGSHRGDESRTPVTILGKRGDVLLMRPLLSHASNQSHPDTRQHRRILHYEFAGVEELPDGYVWHDFLPAELTFR
jgi:hypothetical protein